MTTLQDIDKQIVYLLKQRVEMTSPDQYISLLLMQVAAVCDVTVEDIQGRSKHRKVTDARCIFIHHMLESGFRKLSIALMLRRNHVSISNALDKYRSLYANDIDFRLMAIKVKDQWSKQSNTLLQHLKDQEA